MSRIVAENMPHHVVQRGNRRQQVFFNDKDKVVYLGLLKESIQRFNLRIWSYCLMDNHVHLIVVPDRKEALAEGIGWVHKEYTRMINFRKGWRGYLWQGRFSSFVLDEKYLYAAVRYVERNPVRAGVVKRAGEYKFSSALARITEVNNNILSDFYLLKDIKNWEEYLSIGESENDLKLMRRHGATGRPLGSGEFMEALAKRLGVDLTPKKRGPTEFRNLPGICPRNSKFVNIKTIYVA